MTERHEIMYRFFEEAEAATGNSLISKLSDILDVGDRGARVPCYMMCYSSNLPNLRGVLGPDYTFHSWPSANIPSFQEEVKKILAAGEFPAIKNKLGWYGNVNSPLGDVIESKTRPFLALIGSTNKDIMDIVDVRVPQSMTTGYLSLEDLVKTYSFLLDIGGNGYSGRLKYLLFSNRPLLLVDREYIEYFHADLQPYVHYIPVAVNLSNFLEQYEWARNHLEECSRIAANAREFAIDHFSQKKLYQKISEVAETIFG